MAGKERSPRFPGIPLSEAVEFIEKLYSEAGRTAVSQLVSVKAMGYKSVNGRSLAVLGALRGYGLLDGKKDEISVSEMGLRIIRRKSDNDRRTAINNAVLLPPLFSEIAEKYGDCSEGVLAAQLLHRGFTEDGAARAANVYHSNKAFAEEQFDDIVSSDAGDERSDENPSPPPLPSSPKMNSTLPIPLDVGDALIPKGMSEDDFSLLLETLQLWKRKIVAKTPDRKDSDD